MVFHALEIARALIQRPSITPHDAGALEVLEALLKDAGFNTHRLKFSDEDTPDIDNLYARWGTGEPHFCFAGHTDVVPPGESSLWSHPPFGAEIFNGKLYGRGAVDMKGAIAAFTAAALEWTAQKPSTGSISLMITGDEEGPGVNGTTKILQWLQERDEIPDHCLVGEPTNPHFLGEAIKIGRRGSLSGEIVVQGVQGHSAYPQLAKNPIEILARVVMALSEQPLDPGTEFFDPTRLVFTSFDVGNAARNVIPNSARALFNVRYSDFRAPDALKREVLRIARTAAADAAIEVVFMPSNSPCFRTEPGAFTKIVAQAVEHITGNQPELSTSGGTSDARFIAVHCPVVEFGLVGRTMHAIDECVDVADIEKLQKIYAATLKNYFKAFESGEHDGTH